MQEQKPEDMFQMMENFPSSAYYGLAVMSILASAALFFMGKRNWAVFVGQWPPTIMLMAVFSKLLRPSQENIGQQVSQAVKSMREAA